MKNSDVYLPESDQLLEQIEDEYDWYCWEEQDWMENRLMYEYGLEYLEDLSSREKINGN